MITNYTKEELIDFETDIAECFNNAQIKAPVHLYDGNEEQMIEMRKEAEMHAQNILKMK